MGVKLRNYENYKSPLLTKERINNCANQGDFNFDWIAVI